MEKAEDSTEKNKLKKTIPEDTTAVILDSISDGVFTVDLDWRITSFNRAAEEITGIDRKEAIGRFCWEVFRSNMCEGDCALKRTMKEGKSFVSSSTYIINGQRQRVPIHVSTSVLKNRAGFVLGGVETFRDHSLVEELRKEIAGRHVFGDMVSRSKPMQDIFAILNQVAESDSTVLIEGETGTGKEVMARTIHNQSPRKAEPFMAINCGALPDNLLESELFGYKTGAFTGANKDKDGLFTAAGDGTIFLDEIGETSSAFQVRLLRVLEEREYQPLGSVEKRKCRARIITATNRILPEMVEVGNFRKDLFYRINTVRLTLPPLRERTEDIPLLVDTFIYKLNRLQGKDIVGISEEALAMLLRHDFPGNIRELENIIEHGFILCSDGVIKPEHLPQQQIHVTVQPVTAPVAKFSDFMEDTEAKIIMKTLEDNGFNRLATAKALGIHKATLFRKIKKLGIELPKRDGRSASLPLKKG